MKRSIILVTILLIATIELIALYNFSSRYEHTIAYTIFIPFYVFTVFITIIAFSSKRRAFGMTSMIAILLLIILPIILFITKPSFTFQEAQEYLKENENVQIINHDYRTIESENGRVYRILAERHGKEVIFVFSPRSGEYEEIEE